LWVTSTWHPSRARASFAGDAPANGERPASATSPAAPPSGPTRRAWGLAAGGFVLLGLAVWSITISPVFGLKTVRVSGNVHVTAGEIVKLGGLSGGKHLLWMSVGKVEQGIERNPWVLSASISRSLPGMVLVQVHERTPIAQAADGRWLVARDGTVLDRPSARIARFPTVPLPDGLRAGMHLSTTVPLQVARSMSPSLLRRAEGIAVGSGLITVSLRHGGTAVYGDGSSLEVKSEALDAVLEWSGRRGISIGYVDVRAPFAPALAGAGATFSTPPASQWTEDGLVPAPWGYRPIFPARS
jgi:cell division septal protein FtsQ